MMAHCRATVTAVRTWSPVTMAVRMQARCRCWMAGSLSGLSLRGTPSHTQTHAHITQGT